LAEELVLLLVLAAGRDFWRGSSLVTTAQFSSEFIRLLSQFVVVV
jgi:hypothetical protein